MSQSLSQLYVHIIFHVNHRLIAIRQVDANKLYAYLGTLLKGEECSPILINGTHDHVHIFCILSKNVALSKLTQHLKSISSQWLKQLDPYYSKFAWQKGYGAFSVSPSVREKTISYISKQLEHHQRINFKEEYLLFLEEYGVEYNEMYLWED